MHWNTKTLLALKSTKFAENCNEKVAMQCTAVYYESGSFFARKIKNRPLILGQNGRGSVETEVLSRPDSFSVFFFFFF